jgi:hypothetical protein
MLLLLLLGIRVSQPGNSFRTFLLFLLLLLRLFSSFLCLLLFFCRQTCETEYCLVKVIKMDPLPVDKASFT